MASEISNLFNPQTEQKFRFWLSWVCVAMLANLLVNAYFFVFDFNLKATAPMIDYISYFNMALYMIIQTFLIVAAWQMRQKQQIYTQQQDEFSLQQLLEAKYKLICVFVGYLGLELYVHIFWRLIYGYINDNTLFQF